MAETPVGVTRGSLTRRGRALFAATAPSRNYLSVKTLQPFSKRASGRIVTHHQKRACLPSNQSSVSFNGRPLDPYVRKPVENLQEFASLAANLLKRHRTELDGCQRTGTNSSCRCRGIEQIGSRDIAGGFNADSRCLPGQSCPSRAGAFRPRGMAWQTVWMGGKRRPALDVMDDKRLLSGE